jgi:uncharacterized RDD family membrane protein YckC
LVCGYQVPANTPEPKREDHSFPGMIEMDYSEGTQEPSPKEELPQWRKELSQRLQAIKQKREGAQIQTKAPVPIVEPKPIMHIERAPVRKPVPKLPVPVPRQKTLQPLEPEPITAKPVLKTADPQEIQKLIDSIVSRQSATAPVPIPEIPSSAPETFVDREGKLILLSRTLSGLVDLIFVTLCAGGVIVAADFFSGIVALDTISFVDFSALFLLTYFVYSIFFLAASCQTIGMMITNLRVVGVGETRPSLRQLLGRCCVYLVSLLGLGIGLLWSLFDRQSLCLHDRFSDTRIVRI